MHALLPWFLKIVLPQLIIQHFTAAHIINAYLFIFALKHCIDKKKTLITEGHRSINTYSIILFKASKIFGWNLIAFTTNFRDEASWNFLTESNI